jgi:hypothetical protein
MKESKDMNTKKYRDRGNNSSVYRAPERGMLRIIKSDIGFISPQLKFIFAVPLFTFIFAAWAGFCASVVAPRYFGRAEYGIPVYLLMVFSPLILIGLGFYLKSVYSRSR